VSAQDRPRESKRALRSELIAVRARLTLDDRRDKSRTIADRIEKIAAFRDAPTIALYAPLGTEVDSLEMARRALARGVRILFPRVVPGERRLAFARSSPEDLVRGPLGASEPPERSPEVPAREIACVVMPGVAFSLDGLRLGRGGGYYDATLNAMAHVARIGVAYDVQIVPALPREPHDAPLDAIVTEARALLFPERIPLTRGHAAGFNSRP
jgi:5-formyltetrahydrofolate cyclo-ligase